MINYVAQAEARLADIKLFLPKTPNDNHIIVSENYDDLVELLKTYFQEFENSNPTGVVFQEDLNLLEGIIAGSINLDIQSREGKLYAVHNKLVTLCPDVDDAKMLGNLGAYY